MSKETNRLDELKQQIQDHINTLEPWDEKRAELRGKEIELAEQLDKLEAEQAVAFSYAREDKKLKVERDLDNVVNQLKDHEETYYSDENKQVLQAMQQTIDEYKSLVHDTHEGIQNALALAKESAETLIRANQSYIEQLRIVEETLSDEIYTEWGYPELKEDPFASYADRFNVTLHRQSELAELIRPLETYISRIKVKSE